MHGDLGDVTQKLLSFQRSVFNVFSLRWKWAGRERGEKSDRLACTVNCTNPNRANCIRHNPMCIYTGFLSWAKICIFNLYISLVRPRLEYACPVWSPHSSGAVARIESVQKLGLRIVSGGWNAEYSDLLAEFQIPTLERRRSELSLCLLYKLSKSLFFSRGPH